MLRRRQARKTGGCNDEHFNTTGGCNEDDKLRRPESVTKTTDKDDRRLEPRRQARTTGGCKEDDRLRIPKTVTKTTGKDDQRL